MKNEIFRKKSLEKVNSPESLDDYIKVSNPSIWLILISVIILLIGTCVWGIFGHIDSIVDTSIHIENGKVVCYISEKDISSTKVGMTVKYENQKAVISSIEKMDGNGYICILDADNVLSDGFYEGKIVIDSFKPISFIVN